jgi:hypothetical protein
MGVKGLLARSERRQVQERISAGKHFGSGERFRVANPRRRRNVKLQDCQTCCGLQHISDKRNSHFLGLRWSLPLSIGVLIPHGLVGSREAVEFGLYSRHYLGPSFLIVKATVSAFGPAVPLGPPVSQSQSPGTV